MPRCQPPKLNVYIYFGVSKPITLLFFSFPAVASASDAVLKLMGSYLVFAFTGFVLILLFLEKIGAKSDPEKPCLQVSVFVRLSLLHVFPLKHFPEINSRIVKDDQCRTESRLLFPTWDEIPTFLGFTQFKN